MENVKKPTGQLSKGQKRRAAQKLRKIAEGYKVAPTKPEVDGVFDFLNSKLTQNSTKHTANAIQVSSWVILRLSFQILKKNFSAQLKQQTDEISKFTGVKY